MLGYVTKRSAIKEGFTHNGRYYGIPVYMQLGTVPMVCVKWAPLEVVMIMCHYIEGFVHGLQGTEPLFAFKVLSPLEENKNAADS